MQSTSFTQWFFFFFFFKPHVKSVAEHSGTEVRRRMHVTLGMRMFTDVYEINGQSPALCVLVSIVTSATSSQCY